jgi:hypothetical protein
VKKDSMVKRIIVIVVAVQILLACSLLNRPAAALEQDQDPEQLWNIGWELSQDCCTRKEPFEVKDNRRVRLRDSGHTHGRLPPVDLLQELMPSQDTVLLEELLVETLMP